MTDAAIIQIAIQTMVVTAKLSAPILLVSLAIGSAVSVLQSVTQVQEFTLTFVPKLVGIALVLVVSGNWMIAELTGFTRDLFALIPALIG
ncbi:MAG: flagellar biosynthetic protein FliQ [Acidimicrobiia bacterium]